MAKLLVSGAVVVVASLIGVGIRWLRSRTGMEAVTGTDSTTAGAIGGAIGAAVDGVVLSPLPGWGVMRILLVLPEVGMFAGAATGAAAHFIRYRLSTPSVSSISGSKEGVADSF